MNTNRKHQVLAFFGILILTASLGAAKDKTVKSQWHDGGIKIDGAPNDWPEVRLFTESKTKVELSIVNDASDLYLRLSFMDPKSLSSIQSTGLKIWLSPETQSKERFGVHLMPKQISGLDMISRFEKKQGPLSEAQKTEIHQKAPFTVFEGQPINRKGDSVTLTSLEEINRPVAFRPYKSNNHLGYEIRIPLKVKEWGLGILEASVPIRLEFEWGGMTKEMREAMMRKRAESASQASQGATRFETRGDDSDEAPVVGETRMGFQRGAAKHSFHMFVILAKQ
jgi:hypothetical protein